jgi:DNA polymerase-3 subunit delta
MTGKGYEDILRDLRAGKYAPVYYLMGEEDFYIDRIADYIAEHILTDDEKGFNLLITYGADTDMANVISLAKRYPMMAKYQVIIVKEAQGLSGNTEDLVYYLQKPLDSTILVFCHKHGTLDKRKKLATEIAKKAVLFESPTLKEGQIPGFIVDYLRTQTQASIEIEPKAAAMLVEFVGTDLSRLTGELEKLLITLPKGATRITDAQIEQNIGISKDYNTFELRSAIVTKDILKANTIVKHFADNPKTYPIQMVLPLLFSFFSNLMLAYYAPEKSEQGVASMLGLRSPWQAGEYLRAMRNFSGLKVMEIIGEIRYTDARSKGIKNNTASGGDLLRELVFKILH